MELLQSPSPPLAPLPHNMQYILLRCILLQCILLHTFAIHTFAMYTPAYFCNAYFCNVYSCILLQCIFLYTPSTYASPALTLPHHDELCILLQIPKKPPWLLRLPRPTRTCLFYSTTYFVSQGGKWIKALDDNDTRPWRFHLWWVTVVWLGRLLQGCSDHFFSYPPLNCGNSSTRSPSYRQRKIWRIHIWKANLNVEDHHHTILSQLSWLIVAILPQGRTTHLVGRIYHDTWFTFNNSPSVSLLVGWWVYWTIPLTIPRSRRVRETE